MRRRGMGLAEVGIALLILGLAILPMLDLLMGAHRQVRQSNDLDLVLAVEDKIGEELRLASWENTRFLEEGMPADPALLPLANGGSPFFAAIEDSAAPFGRIHAGEDLAITPQAGPVHDALRDFSAGVGSRVRALATTGSVVDVDVAVAWSDFRATAVRQDHDIALPARTGGRAAPAQVEDRDAADRAISAALYADPQYTSLAALAAARGAQLAMVRAAGDVVLIATGLRDANRALAAQLASPNTVPLQTPFGPVSPDLALARLLETQAAASLTAAVYLAPLVKSLAATFDPAQLGTPPVQRQRLAAAQYLTAVYPALIDDLTRTRLLLARAYAATGASALRPRARVRVFLKLLAICKLEALTSGTVDVAAIRRMLADFMELEEGREPNFYQLALFEADHCKDLATLRESYGDPAWLQALADFRDAAPAAAARLRQ